LVIDFGEGGGEQGESTGDRVVPAEVGLEAGDVAVQLCPACLAGDGSPIQNLHGGPWQRAWRLPVFFLCLQHQCL
jgi:hypothetical protein